MQIIGEHEKAENENEKSSASYQPTPEEEKTIKLVEKLFDKAKKHKAMYDEKWVNNYHMFRGKQWKEARPSYRHSEVVNMIFQTIQSTVPIQTDSRPRFSFLPSEPSDVEFAEILNHVAESDWIRQNWSQELTEVIYEANFYGAGMSELCYDPDALMGAGQILYKSFDPFYCFPDPSARDVNKECEYFITAEPLDVEKIKRKYFDKAEYIKADLVDLMSSAKNDLSNLKFRSPTDIKVTMEGGNPVELTYKDKALLLTCYLKSDDYDEVENEAGEYEQIKKYPLGRKIVVCNRVLLEDNENPYDDGLFPFQRLINYTLPREFWGISEVEQLEGPQKTFNKLISFALDVLTLMGNPVWLNPTSSDVDSENLTNRPGLVIDHNPGSAPTRLEGVQLQPYVLNLAESMRVWFNEISGSQDVTRGIQPTGITAASAISSLQDAAQTRLRQKARHLDAYLQDLGQQYVSRVFQFYSAPRLFRITGKDGAEQFFKMHITEDEATGKKKAYISRNGEVQTKEYLISGEFDVRVVTGSTLPFARAEKEQRLLNLFDRGVIDDEEVLKGIEYPNWEAVKARVEEKKAMAAQAQAQPQPAG